MELWYEADQIPADLAVALTTLAEGYSLKGSKSAGLQVAFAQTGEPRTFEVQVESGRARVHYHSLTQACRGIGLLLGLLDGQEGQWREQCGFKTVGLMLDCSRNAVMRVDQIKKWLRHMALSGYNMLMLYTEDTYELPAEPLFGYGRGPYTMAEVQEIDAYASSLGIEVIPCIQTLGHLEQILKWGHAYGAVRDTSSVLLVDDPQTYDLIRKMLRFWSQAVRSRRIHIGMDETHDLGRGRYMDLHGYKRGFDIFNEHLSKVVALSAEEGLEPMIWSDMYFRMGSKTGDYYDQESEVPASVAAAIPGETYLVYWDYYHTDEAFYHEWITRHRQMGFEPIMGSGIWTWGRFVHSHVYTSQTVLPCVRACLAEGLEEIFFTMWKDDGAGVDFDSALAGVLYAAEAAYNAGEVGASWEVRFRGVCQASLAANLAISRLDAAKQYGDEANARMLLWDDPLLGMYRRTLLARESQRDFDPATYYADLAEELSPFLSGGSGQAGNLAFGQQLARTVSLKASLYDRVTHAYSAGDKKALSELAETSIPEVISAVKTLWKLHREVWMDQNKAAGFEVQCIRYGGLLLRLEEVQQRIEEYLSGEIPEIEELSSPVAPLTERLGRYRSVATPSSIL